MVVQKVQQTRVMICDCPRQNQPYCAGLQSEIVAQGDYY